MRLLALLLEHVPGSRDELVEHTRIDRRPVSGDLDRRRAVTEGTSEERPRRLAVTTLRDEDVDHLPVLIDRPFTGRPSGPRP